MADQSRQAVHTTRKRLAEVQAGLASSGQQYRAFDQYDLPPEELLRWAAQSAAVAGSSEPQ